MAKIRLTRYELKRQREALERFLRYLPILELKKKQLQIEISQQEIELEKKRKEEKKKREEILIWAGLLEEMDLKPWVLPSKRVYGTRNIAGIEVIYLERLEFSPLDYDLFLTPFWVDLAIRILREWIKIKEEILVLEKVILLLREELRITTQRVNLFEKIKIPEAEEAIRIIKIFLGDQMANAIARSKIAKKKLQKKEALEVV